jgi:type IV secretory pathway TrbD component
MNVGHWIAVGVLVWAVLAVVALAIVVAGGRADAAQERVRRRAVRRPDDRDRAVVVGRRS